ncbi:hypothetical protein BDP27DRAFT_1448955 [Rhodocollybia butyracea]|uniref:Uncharacterized protein n=1 Tax=Rhodocollybia butyracea TaxID=206335 RepID=A0A9P5U5D2_9AGAR|nr:hypothetical protein BDP27DRAFT_1448955 [Rhodocollybia butyracea]
MEFLLGSPALRDVKIVECGDISITSESHIPFEQLTSLKINHAEHQMEKPDLIFELPRRCSNIVMLELCMPLGLEFSAASPILLPSLRSLAIRSGGDNMGPLCHISAPFLEDLSLSWPYRLDNLPRLREEVIYFQQKRSFSSLSSLTIKEIRQIDKRMARMLLSAFPSIKLFRIVNVKYKITLFECLTLPGFEFTPEDASTKYRSWERQLLCNMIHSRCWTELDTSGHNGSTCLQKVTLDQGSE